MRMFALVRANGSMAIMRLVDAVDPQTEMAKWSPERRAEFVSVVEIDPANLPQDRAHRNAWRYSQVTGFTVDPAAASQIDANAFRAIERGGAAAMLSRHRAEAVSNIERRIRDGASQEEINIALLDLLKE